MASFDSTRAQRPQLVKISVSPATAAFLADLTIDERELVRAYRTLPERDRISIKRKVVVASLAYRDAAGEGLE